MSNIKFVVRKWFTPRYRKTGGWVDSFTTTDLDSAKDYYDRIKTELPTIKWCLIELITEEKIIESYAKNNDH